MSFVLRKDGMHIAVSGGWNPTLFGHLTETSFPVEADESFAWSHEDYTLAWEADAP